MKPPGAHSLVRWGYGAIAALVITMAWALYTAAADSKQSAHSVDHTLDALGHIAEINDSLSRALSSHRGYLLFGQDRFLAQRDESMARAYDEIARVRALTVDNPSQQARLAALEDRVEKRRTLMESSAAEKRIALERGVAEAPQTGSGQNITSAIHALTAAMKAEELRLLDERRIHQQERFTWALQLFGAVVVVMLVIAIPGYVAYARASRAKRQTELRMHELAESLPGAVFQFRAVAGGAGRYEFLSESTAALRGVDPKAALRDPSVIFDTIVAEDKDALFAALAAAGEALRPLVHDFRVKDREEGGTRWIRVSSAPRRDADGTVLWSGHWGDVTEQKRMERQLRHSKEAADAANRAKSTFLATMSHEIRTPMNGVLGMLELLSLMKLDGEQRTTLEIVRESGRSLLRIIDDILDFSKIEADAPGGPPPACSGDGRSRAAATDPQ
jgi:PAS domain S-box-containing protein